MGNNTEEKNPNNERVQPSKILVDFLKEINLDLFIDQFGEPHVVVPYMKSPMKIESSDFHRWIRNTAYHSRLDKMFSNDAITQAQHILYSQASERKVTKNIFLRVGMHEGKIYYDLGDDTVVSISPDGWSIESESPILFRRYKGQTKQVQPKKGQETISEFLQLVNIKNQEEKLLFQTFLISAFIPDLPHPILVAHGQQGSAKSTLFRMIKELVDPWEVKTLTMPRDPNQFIQLASHHWLAAFDNLSGLSSEISDSIARVVTGHASSKRKLYTDDDDFIYKFQHIIAINGVNNVASKSDLLDRAILIELSRISENERKTEKELKEKFEAMKPSVLAHCFDLIVKALQIEPKVDLKAYHRMADFMRWGYAITNALGVEGEQFISAYTANVQRRDDEAISASPVALTIMEFMKTYEDMYIEKDPTILLMDLSAHADAFSAIDTKYNKAWPRDARWLWRKMTEVAPNLEAKGLKISNGRSDRRFIRIEKTEKFKPDVNRDNSVIKNDTSPLDVIEF